MASRRITFMALLFAMLQAATAYAIPLTTIKESEPRGVPTVQYALEDGSTEALTPNGKSLTVLHFWASWCVPCVKELPELDALAGEYRNRSIQFIILSLDGMKTGMLDKFYTTNNIANLPKLYDQRLSAYRNLKLRGLPSTVFINEEGKEIGRADGPLDWSSDDTHKFLEKNVPESTNSGMGPHNVGTILSQYTSTLYPPLIASSESHR